MRPTPTLRCVIPGQPTGKGRPRFSRRSGRAYTPQTTRDYEAHAAAELRAAWGDRAPLTGPTRVEVVAAFRRPQRLLKRGVGDERLPHDGRIDIDNVAKAVLDAMQLGGVLADDRCVHVLAASKWYAARGESEHVEVLVWGED